MFKKLFGLASSNKTPSEPLIPEENFSIFKFTTDEGLAFATIDAGYDNYPNKKYYPWYATVLLKIHDKNDNGHPTNEEAGILNDLEDRITHFLSETQVVHKIGRVTRNGERDILYYLGNPDLNQNQLKTFFDSINAIRPINFKIEKDEKWKNVSAFLK